jgi:hypothetical protein
MITESTLSSILFAIRLTKFREAIWQSLKYPRQIDQTSGKKYMNLFIKKREVSAEIFQLAVEEYRDF